MLTTDLDGYGAPLATLQGGGGAAGVAGVVCVPCSASASCFGLLDELLADWSEDGVAVHGLVAPRIAVIFNGLADCSPLLDTKALREP